MPVLTISNGLYSNAQKIIDGLGKKLGYTLITDRDIIEQTAKQHDLKPATIKKVLQNKQIMFNNYTREKEKCIACLKQTTSEFLERDKCLLHGFLGHLVPVSVSHLIRVLIITDKETRVKNGMEHHGNTKKETLKTINNFDKQTILLSKEIMGKSAFEESLYDIVIPTDKMTTEQSVQLITENSTAFSGELVKKEISDFQLAAHVEVALSKIGSKLQVDSDDGNVTITIDKSVIMLAKFKEKITNIAKGMNGVKSAETKLGRNYYSNTVVRRLNVETPSRLLLVDDEKEFVQTLSDRLKLREFNSEIAFDGEEALKITEKEETEVMILDLKMPGIDGFEVLRKIKKNKPHIEVIILTGHGSEDDRQKCLDLGAFAYLQKPADIELLTDTMKQAYEKISKTK
jgi:CheY-like chemotaxis protein/cytidylate kinase